MHSRLPPPRVPRFNPLNAPADERRRPFLPSEPLRTSPRPFHPLLALLHPFSSLWRDFASPALPLSPETLSRHPLVLGPQQPPHRFPNPLPPDAAARRRHALRLVRHPSLPPSSVPSRIDLPSGYRYSFDRSSPSHLRDFYPPDTARIFPDANRLPTPPETDPVLSAEIVSRLCSELGV